MKKVALYMRKRIFHIIFFLLHFPLFLHHTNLYDGKYMLSAISTTNFMKIKGWANGEIPGCLATNHPSQKSQLLLTNML